MLEIARLLFTQSTNPSVMRPYKQFLQHAFYVFQKVILLIFLRNDINV